MLPLRTLRLGPSCLGRLVLASQAAGTGWCCCWCLGWCFSDWPLRSPVPGRTGFRRQALLSSLHRHSWATTGRLLTGYWFSWLACSVLAGASRCITSRLGPTLLVAGSPPRRLNKGSICEGVTVRSGSRIICMSRRSRLESVKGPLPHYVAQYEVGKVVTKGAGGLLSAFRDGLHNPSQTQTQSSGRPSTQTQSSGRYPTQTQSAGRNTTRPPGQVRGGAASPGRGRVGVEGRVLEWIKGELRESGGVPKSGVESDGVRGLGPGGTRDLGLGSGRQPKALPRSRR